MSLKREEIEFRLQTIFDKLSTLAIDIESRLDYLRGMLDDLKQSNLDEILTFK